MEASPLYIAWLICIYLVSVNTHLQNTVHIHKLHPYSAVYESLKYSVKLLSDFH